VHMLSANLIVPSVDISS